MYKYVCWHNCLLIIIVFRYEKELEAILETVSLLSLSTREHSALTTTQQNASQPNKYIYFQNIRYLSSVEYIFQGTLVDRFVNVHVFVWNNNEGKNLNLNCDHLITSSKCHITIIVWSCSPTFNNQWMTKIVWQRSRYSLSFKLWAWFSSNEFG